MTDWQLILAEHGSAVWRTVYRLLDHHADAQDCYQETFLAAWRFAERAPVADWPALLISLATRRAMDRLRKRYRDRARVGLLPEPSGGECPVGHASAQELMARVREGIAALPEKQAQVFWLSCIEGLSHEQIRGRLDITSGEVRVLLHRARTQLSALLAGEDRERKTASQP